MFSGHGEALPLTHDPMFSGDSGLDSTPVMLPRSASHEAATSPIFGLFACQPQLPISAASAADLEGPSPKSHVHAKSQAQRLPQSIAAEF